MLSHIYKKEMIDALRDRKTILLTILVPMIMMLGLVFFYESMLSDKGSSTRWLSAIRFRPHLKASLMRLTKSA